MCAASPGQEQSPILHRLDHEAAHPRDNAERLFANRMGATTTEIPTTHVATVSHPNDVVTMIKTAAAVPIAS
jgi:hypothetical protein